MSSQKTVRPIEILLVEDNPGDVRLTREALKESMVNNNLRVVADGVEAMSYLRQEGKYAEALRPDIIFLDLNLPRKNGHEILMEIKADEELRRIPVLVLTTSEDENDILKAYNNHVNCYITKPVDQCQFIKVMESIEGHWLTIVRLPANRDSRC